MEQLEAVLHAAGLEFLEAPHDLGHGEAKLGAKAPGRLPSSAAPGGELDPHPNLRPYAELFGGFQNETELGVLLDHRNDVAADLERQHRRFDELGVLEPVADDGGVIVGDGDHREQLGLGAGFEAELVRPAEVEHLLDDLPLLVDLDRIHAAVGALVVVLRDGRLEGGVNLAKAMSQDVGEADQHRQADAAQLQPIDQFLEVDGLGWILGGVHLDVTGAVHREVSVPPACHFVELAGVLHAPRAGRGRARRRRRRAAVGDRAHARIMIRGLGSGVSSL